MGAILLLAAVVGSRQLSRTAEVADRLISQVQPARAEAFRIQTALVDQESGVRGYTITGDRRFLKPYTDGLASEKAHARTMSGLLAHDGRLEKDLRTLRRAADDWRRRYATPLITGANAGPARAGERADMEQGRRAFDHLRTLFTQQNAHLEQAGERTEAQLQQTRSVRNWSFVAMLTALLLTGAALAVMLHFFVVRPLRHLRADARRVADGDFGHRISARGPSDLRSVAWDVEDMRLRIVNELAASRSQQQRLTQQAQDLDTQATELRRSNAELEQFAYVASHDLQEPLRKVASFCQLLDKRYGEQLDGRGKQYIDFAVDGAKRMQVLINDLLTFSRVGRLNDAREPVDLDTVLDKALANLTAAVDEADALIERPERLPHVTGDPTLLTMLWQNLIGNAVKFRTPDRAVAVHITVARDAEDNAWRFCVTDNGIGIPEEFADKVFVIFQRLHGRDAYTGTGIGLALCKKIIEHHGGRIWIDTAHSDGARLCFTLPGQPQPPPRPTTNSRQTVKESQREHPARPAHRGPPGRRRPRR
ncbi:HAMP domain-containing protein [Streptomyces dangxiongensis]|uniref:histidine kinase n=1 Tax=Streptomyces dangxiongensis TaxID=1442032 RepID=A0A3G2JNQ0_9ACTN|nr:sensor histidine kinase [Streptomyces dangxiongensis]AYN43993.1 HAMP domain-containing protein [Streptomyces dangxiongensis]